MNRKPLLITGLCPRACCIDTTNEGDYKLFFARFNLLSKWRSSDEKKPNW